MKTVLIVEDEKMIRRGIKTMVQRSGVPVEVIIECNNGETALEIIKEQNIDVMFTDIRMPKMDGIELVKRMQQCEHIPMTVAISGYDDFSYAVEMMRKGVREYILKPVERAKVAEILHKLNQELESNYENHKTIRKIGYQQLKYLMLNKNIECDEVDILKAQYTKDFCEGEYCVCCRENADIGELSGEQYIYLKDIEGQDIFIVKTENIDFLLKNELKNYYVGISDIHTGLQQLRKSYMEAKTMRKKAFCMNCEACRYGEELAKIPEQVQVEADKLVSERSNLQRVQLLGTVKTEEIVKIWKRFFYEVKKGRLTVNIFEGVMEDFFTEVKKTYRNVIEEDLLIIREYECIWNYKNINIYEENFMNWILSLHEKINNQWDTNKNKQKMQQAVEYIKENYNNDLNMAVVSNDISMNYSLFSYSFKQYTGSNFVNFLKKIRMKEAQRLLVDTDMRVIEISKKVGYENEKHFMKTFKTYCGVSPSEYRKNMRFK